MLSRECTNAIADGVIEHARTQERESRASKARPIPSRYRSRELNLLQPWEQQQVVRQAVQSMSPEYWMWPAVVGILLGIPLVWYWIVSKGSVSLPLVALQVLQTVVAAYVRSRVTRKRAQEIALSMLADRSKSHAPE